MNVSVLNVLSGLLKDCTALSAASRDLPISSFRIDRPLGSHTSPHRQFSSTQSIIHQLPYTFIKSRHTLVASNPAHGNTASLFQKPAQSAMSDYPLSPQQHPHNLLHPLTLDRLPQPLPYLPTSNRNRQPRIPLPQIPQLPLNTQSSLPTRIRHRHMRRMAASYSGIGNRQRCFCNMASLPAQFDL